jgi:hypothetical protein
MDNSRRKLVENKYPDQLWEEIQQAAMHDPLVATTLHMARYVDMPREHAALILTRILIDDRARLLKLLIEAKQREMPQPIIMKKECINPLL